MKLNEPKPIRDLSNWHQAAAFSGKVSALSAELLTERRKVVCRECLGFGHARTNCPTRRKLT